MDLKVAAFLHCKSFSWKLFWLPVTLKNNENLSKRVVVFFFFLGRLFSQILDRPRLSPQPHFHSSGLFTPPQALSSINLVQEQPKGVTQNFTTLRAEPTPNSHKEQEYPALMFCYTEGTIFGGFLPQRFCLSAAKSAELKAQSFSGPRGWQGDADSQFQTHSTYP